MSFYDEMADMATELLGEFKQGVCILSRPGGETPGENPWDPPIVTDPVSIELDATVRRVEQRYIDGTLIVGTEDQMTFAVPSVTPAMTDTYTVDGKPRVVKDLRPIPAAGTPVAYIVFLAA